MGNRYIGNRLDPEVLRNHTKALWGDQRRHVEAQFESGMNRAMRQGQRDLAGALEDAAAPITNPIRGVADFFDDLSRRLSGRPSLHQQQQGVYHPVHGSGGYNGGGGYYDIGASRRGASARHIPEEYYTRRGYSGRAFEAGSPALSRGQAPAGRMSAEEREVVRREMQEAIDQGIARQNGGHRAPVEDRSFRHVPDAPAAEAPARQMSTQEFLNPKDPIVVTGGNAEAFRSNRDTVVAQAYPVADHGKIEVRPLESAPVHPKVDEFKQEAQSIVESGGRFDASTYERALKATAPQMVM